MIEDKDFHEALDRIAATPDGELMYLYLQQVVLTVTSPANDGALREDNGRRRFASDLMTLMGKGIDASGGRNGTERPVVLGRHEPADTGRKLTAREWLAKQPRWDDDPNFTGRPADLAAGVPAADAANRSTA
jgi:hypothetical protein